MAIRLILSKRDIHYIIPPVAPISLSMKAKTLTLANKTFHDLGPSSLRDFSSPIAPLLTLLQPHWPCCWALNITNYLSSLGSLYLALLCLEHTCHSCFHLSLPSRLCGNATLCYRASLTTQYKLAAFPPLHTAGPLLLFCIYVSLDHLSHHHYHTH